MEDKKIVELKKCIENAEDKIKAIGTKVVNAKKLLALAIEAYQKNSLLKQCSPVSIVDFCIKCAEAGTDRIGPGGMWAVPYRDKNGQYNVVAIPDYRLIIEKARQAGVIKYAYAEVVKENDKFDYERGLEPKLIHKPAKKERGDIIFVYCVYVLPDRTKDFVVMSKEEIEKIKSRSKNYSEYSPWQTDYEEMAKKTVIKRALKLFEGASPQLSKVLEIDNEAVGYDIPTIEVKTVEIPQPKQIVINGESKNVENNVVEEKQKEVKTTKVKQKLFE